MFSRYGMRTLADLAKNKYMDKKKFEKHEDPASPLLTSTPRSSYDNLQQQRLGDRSTTDVKKQQAKEKEQKKNDKRSAKTSAEKSPEQFNLDDVSAPSFVQTPESIQRMRNQQNFDESRTPEARSRANDYDGPSTSPQSTSRGRNYERTPRSRRNDDAQSTASSVPQMRAYDTPAANRNYNEASSAPEFVLQMRDYETPSTSGGVPKNMSSKQQSPTSVGPRGTTNKANASTAREQTRRARTQTSNTRIWNTIEANSNRRPNSAPRESYTCQSLPIYEYCNRSYEMYNSPAPSYCCVNYNPCRNFNNDCVEVIHDCCYPCQRCQRRRSC